MNELTNRNMTLIERIRDTCAELDPIPHDVLATARAVLKRSASKHSPTEKVGSMTNTNHVH